MGCEFCREKAEVAGTVKLQETDESQGQGLKRKNSLMLQRRPSQLSTTNLDAETGDDSNDEKTAARTLSAEMGMSLVA